MAVQELFADLCVRNAAEAIEFYQKVFGAREKMRLTEPGGRIGPQFIRDALSRQPARSRCVHHGGRAARVRGGLACAVLALRTVRIDPPAVLRDE